MVKIDHRGVGFHVAQGQKKINDDARLHFQQIGERGLLRHALHRFPSFAHGGAQAVLVALGIVGGLAEDVGLGMIHLPARHVLDQLKNRAVVVGVAARGDQLLGDLFKGCLGVDRLARTVGLVGDAAHERDVEGEHRALAEHDHGRARTHRVSDAKLVEHVRIGAGDIGHGIVAEHQPLEHRLVDGAADFLLVRANRLEPGAGDCRPDDLRINRVEIGDAASGVHLLAERHQHEAERCELFGRFHVKNSIRAPRCDAARRVLSRKA